MATYGGSNDENTFDSVGGKKVYSVVDANTGVTTFYERKGGNALQRAFTEDIKLGTMEPGGEFVPQEKTSTQPGFESVYSGSEAKEFLGDENKKILDQQAKETAIRAQKKLGVDEATARLRTEQLMDPNRTTALTDPNQSGDASIAQSAQENLADINDQNQALRDSVSARANTRSGPGSFGDYSYPIDRQALAQQDFMKFTLLEYKPKGQNTNTQFGFGDRDRVGPGGEPKDRVILGSCSLPIPGGIKDENGADWAGDSMNEIQIQAAGLARDLTGASGQDPTQGAKAIADRVGSNNPVVKRAIQETFAGKAVGVQRLMTRATGMIFNPNLELLFDKPVLRGFQFSFDLVPRSKKEALEVVRIIRFFKQGMAPIRSQSNLFLLSPNVFQIHYIKGDDNNRDHPYIGKMKECAMTNFGVDYTPQQNYSTLKDGFMTAYRITMQLKELEPVFNDDYRNDEDSGFASFREDPAEQAALNNTLPAQIGF